MTWHHEIHKHYSNLLRPLLQKQMFKASWMWSAAKTTSLTPYLQCPSTVPPVQYKTNVQSLHYLCCSHDCSCGCNVQSFSPKMHQCVIAFVLCLADILINVLNKEQKKKESHEHDVSHWHCVIAGQLFHVLLDCIISFCGFWSSESSFINFLPHKQRGGEGKVERKRRMEEDCDMSLPLSSGHIFKSLSGKVNWHKGTFVPEAVAKLQFY